MNYLEDYLAEDFDWSLYRMNSDNVPADIKEAISYLQQHANFCYADNVCQLNPFHQLFPFIDGPQSIKIDKINDIICLIQRAFFLLAKHG